MIRGDISTQEEGWKDLNIQDGYIITADTRVTSSDIAMALQLYQPLAGVDAFGIYAFFSENVDYQPLLSKRKMHRNLLTNLNLDIRSFYTLRIRLEALGLLRTFFQSDSLGKIYIYEIQKPQMGTAFFADDLLSALLLENVGQWRFDQLKKKFCPPKLMHQKANEITKNLLDVYNLQRDLLFRDKKQLLIQEDEQNELAESLNTDLDKSFLQQLLAKSFVDAKVIVDNYNALKTVHILYGFDELQIVNLLENAMNVTQNKVDFNEFKKLAHKRFEQLHGVSNQAGLIEKNTQLKASKMVDKNSNLSAADMQLVKACEAYLPLEFLEKIKADLHTFPTATEKNLVRNLVKRQVLPNAVINVLIHYLLSDQDKAYFGLSFENTAADWVKKKIMTPQAAIKQVRQFYQQKAKRSRKMNTNYRKQRPIVQKETLPKWATSEYVSEEKPLDENKSIRIAELLNKINDPNK